MKQSVIALSQNYVTALRTHLKSGALARPLVAQGLGRQAVALGLGTLDQARIHENALVTLKVSPDRTGLMRRAENFFTEFNAPVEETHRNALQSKVQLTRLEETLGQRTEELAISNRQLRRGVDRRKVLEIAAMKSGKDYSKYLQESLELQTHLRQLTHRMMVAQEADRTKISHELQDEIAQTLLGINVRLLSLKNEARTSTKGFHDEITSTQQLVLQSAKFVRQFARGLRTPQPA